MTYKQLQGADQKIDIASTVYAKPTPTDVAVNNGNLSLDH
jgi:hypothetical protein